MPARALTANLAVAPRSVADWLLGGLGVSAAAVSAGFAAYMITVGPAPSGASVNGGDFKVFVAFDRRPRPGPAPGGAPMPPVAAPPQASLRTAGPTPADIDFTPTGSIAPAAGRTAPALLGLGKPTTEARHRLAGFAVRDVFDGKAVIEVRNRLTIVEPGSLIEGAGSVVAIRQGESGWVVETTGGVIGR